MPISALVDVSDGTPDVADISATIFAAIYRAVAELREVRVRGNRAQVGVKHRALTPSTKVVLDVEEDPSELARQAMRCVVDQILADADGEHWRGCVELIGDPDDKGKPKLIESIKVELQAGAPAPKPSRDDEITGLIAASTAACASLAKTVGELGSVIVKVGSTKAEELAAYGGMITALSDMMRRMGQSQGKWEYRITREKEETSRHEETERARAAKSRAFWDAFETFATEWKDVGMVWSKWITEQGKKGGNAQQGSDAPTPEECALVFGALDFCERQIAVEVGGNLITATIRTTVAEIISEPDAKNRMALARRLGAMTGKLTQDERTQLAKHTVEVLGLERAQKVATWLSAPFAFTGTT